MLEREIDGEEDAGRQDSAIDIDFEAQEATIIPDVNIEAPRLSPRLKLSKNTANIKVKRLRKASPRSPSSHATRQQMDAPDTPISTDATASSRVDDGAALRVTTPETESEPDYIASRSPGFKSPDPRQSYNASGAQRAGQLLNAGSTSERWISPSEEILGQTEPTGGFTYPRHGTIPVSLTGIGAAHLELEGDLLQEKGLIDDEFQLMTRPEAATPLMITTDAQT
jgi:hypothetical protein